MNISRDESFMLFAKPARREGGGREEGGFRSDTITILYIFTWEVERRFANRAYSMILYYI